MVVGIAAQGSRSNMITPPRDGESPPKRIKLTEAAAADEDPELSWKEDPLRLSDWDIEVVSSSTADDGADDEDNLFSTTYHVHRCVLAFGEKRSRYFVRLFQDNETFPQSSTKFTLDPLAADAFPALLDYLYDPASRTPLKVRTETATALLYLGEFLDMPTLRTEVQEFCGGDMSADTVATYLEQAERFDNQFVMDEIVSFLEDTIRNNIDTPASALTALETKSPASLWSKVATEVTRNKYQEDENDVVRLDRLSTYLTQVLELHKDTKTFQTLTAEDTMPRVDPTVALTLCEIQDQLGGKEETSLHLRCAQGLASKWNDLASVGATQAKLLQQKPTFLLLLLDCCNKAKDPKQEPAPLETSTLTSIALVQMLHNLAGGSSTS